MDKFVVFFGGTLSFRKPDLEIAVGPRGSPSGPTFWSGLEAADHIYIEKCKKSLSVLTERVLCKNANRDMATFVNF